MHLTTDVYSLLSLSNLRGALGLYSYWTIAIIDLHYFLLNMGRFFAWELLEREYDNLVALLKESRRVVVQAHAAFVIEPYLGEAHAV